MKKNIIFYVYFPKPGKEEKYEPFINRDTGTR